MLTRAAPQREERPADDGVGVLARDDGEFRLFIGEHADGFNNGMRFPISRRMRLPHHVSLR
ncbi:hypothetical protein GCM10027061_08430 [Nesterenkonia suensis]